MKVLLCASTEFELLPTMGTIADERVQYLITGVGLLATTFALTEYLQKSEVNLVIQAGIGGSLDESLPAGVVVSVSRDCIGDLGVEEGGAFKNLVTLGLQSQNEEPFEDGWLVNTNAFTHSLPSVDAVSLNEITTLPSRIQYYRSLGAKVESMEGAALHYVCLRKKIPFLQLRSISNFAGERNKQLWKMEEAIQALNGELQKILQSLLS